MSTLLEVSGKYSDFEVVKRRAVKMGNRLVNGNRRDVLKLVAKRLPCTCLKKLYSATRTKLGACHGCLMSPPLNRSQELPKRHKDATNIT